MSSLVKGLASAVIAGSVTFAFASLAAEPDCAAPEPGAKEKGAALSRKLMTCGSVLKPSGAGDPDIIVPPPAVDDPIAVHPKLIDPDEKSNDSP